VLGILAGIIFGEDMGNVSFLGTIFLRLIQMSVVLLVMSAIIESVGSIEPADLGKIGIKALVLFIVTTVISAVMGVFMVNIIKPGVGITGVLPGKYEGQIFSISIPQLITEFFPKNVMQSMVEGNMVQVIVFSIFFGLAISLTRQSEGSKRVYALVVDFGKVIMEIIKIVMRFAPIGVFALLGSITGTIGIGVIVPLVKFLAATFITCLAVLVFNLGIVSAYARVNPIKVLYKLKNTIIVSIATTSSAISLPVQMEDCEKKLGISPRISRLVNSLAMSLNSDGLAVDDSNIVPYDRAILRHRAQPSVSR